MTRTKRIFKNFISATLLQFVMLIVNFIVPRVVIKYYGSEMNGLATSILQFVGYFKIVEAGLASAATYALYKPLANNDKGLINTIVSTVKKFYYKSGCIFMLLVLCLAFIYPLILNNNLMNYFNEFLLIIIIGANGFLDFFTLAKYRVLLTADQRAYVISISSIVYYIVYVIIIFLMSKAGSSIILVRFFSLIAIIVRSIILYIYVKRNYKYIDYNSKVNNGLLNKRWDALYLQILGVIQTSSPIIILTFFSNLITVSIYSIYDIIIHGINSILSTFTNGLSASYGDLIVRGEKERLKSTSEEFEYIYYNIITIVYTASFFLIMPFIKLYTASFVDGNYYIPIVGFFFILNGFLYNIKTPQGMLVISAGMYKETRIQTTIQGLICIVLGIILVPKYGIIGVLVASMLSNLYRDVDLLIFACKKITNRSILSTLKRQIKMLFLSSILLFLINILFKTDIGTIYQWLTQAAMIFLFELLCIFLFDLLFDRIQLKKVLARIKMLVGVK